MNYISLPGEVTSRFGVPGLSALGNFLHSSMAAANNGGTIVNDVMESANIV